jgi:membrane protein DedA with SNARE-associated domain
VLLENVFPPIPSEVVLPAAGLYAERNGGLLPLLGMILAATCGSVLGAWVLYGVSALVGPDRLRAFVVRRGRWLGVKERDFDRAEGWFDNHEQLAVLIARWVPLVRSLVSVPAGFRRMSPVRFTGYTALGSAVWNAALILVGYAASSYQDRVEKAIGYVQYLVIAVLVVGVAWFVFRRLSASRAEVQPASDDAEERLEATGR